MAANPAVSVASQPSIPTAVEGVADAAAEQEAAEAVVVADVEAAAVAVEAAMVEAAAVVVAAAITTAP